MAITRYRKSSIFFNSDPDFRKAFKKRYGKLDELKQLETLHLNYPSFQQISNFDYANHIWTLGDRYYKLAYEYYGSSEYWWVIAWFNKKPTEQHLNLGDLVKVPMPLADVLTSLGL